jgi:hypothetical protein
MPNCGPNYFSVAAIVDDGAGGVTETALSTEVVNADPTTQDLGVVAANYDTYGNPYTVSSGGCTWVESPIDAPFDEFTFWYHVVWRPNEECDLVSYEGERQVVESSMQPWEEVAGVSAPYLNSGIWYSVTVPRLTVNALLTKYKGKFRVRARYSNGDTSDWLLDEEDIWAYECQEVTADLGPLGPAPPGEGGWHLARDDQAPLGEPEWGRYARAECPQLWTCDRINRIELASLH